MKNRTLEVCQARIADGRIVGRVRRARHLPK
jgi:hypothetical protein